MLFPVSVALRARLALLSLAIALISLLLTGVVFASWTADRARLQQVAEAVTAGASNETERLTRLVDWVYHNQGFRKNRDYFVWKALDATPIQVLERGGDCEDKSKLVSAMLHELGVRSSLAMLYPCKGCAPTHVVSLVETSSGWTPVDPVYNITFEDRSGRFTPIEAMRADPNLLLHRLDELEQARGPADKINRYKRDIENYEFVTTVNWDKNVVTRAIAAIIRWSGNEPWLMPRPMFLVDPKHFFVVVGLCMTLGFALLSIVISPKTFQARRDRNAALTPARDELGLAGHGQKASVAAPVES